MTDALYADAERGDEAATALLSQLFLGLRTSEILLRTVPDLDDGGRILTIPYGKTKSARRRLEVPESLRPFLLRQAAGKGLEATALPLDPATQTAALRALAPEQLAAIFCSIAESR